MMHRTGPCLLATELMSMKDALYCFISGLSAFTDENIRRFSIEMNKAKSKGAKFNDPCGANLLRVVQRTYKLLSVDNNDGAFSFEFHSPFLKLAWEHFDKEISVVFVRGWEEASVALAGELSLITSSARAIEKALGRKNCWARLDKELEGLFMKQAIKTDDEDDVKRNVFANLN